MKEHYLSQSSARWSWPLHPTQQSPQASQMDNAPPVLLGGSLFIDENITYKRRNPIKVWLCYASSSLIRGGCEIFRFGEDLWSGYETPI